MEKKVKVVNGEKFYLLGKRKEDNKNVWLQNANFDCSWYWGVGYIEIFNNKNEIIEHTHFDALFFNNKKSCYDLFKDYFMETTLEDKEIWQLLEIMETIYTMRKYSDMLYRGGSYITENVEKDIIKNDTEYKRINDVLIPKLLEDIYALLSKN